jgi:AcrR family transcriptional regulator
MQIRSFGVKMTAHFDRDIRCEQILDAAAKLFASQGYENSTVDDIAKSSGLSKGSIYYYFRSKLEILFALTERSVNQTEHADLRVAAVGRYGPQAIYKLPRELYTLDQLHPDRINLLGQLYSLASRHPEIRERLVEYHRRWDNASAELIEQAINEGQIKPVDGKLIGQSISCLYYGVYLRKQLDPDVNFVAVMESATKLLYDALIIPPPEPTLSGMSADSMQV